MITMNADQLVDAQCTQYRPLAPWRTITSIKKGSAGGAEVTYTDMSGRVVIDHMAPSAVVEVRYGDKRAGRA